MVTRRERIKQIRAAQRAQRSCKQTAKEEQPGKVYNQEEAAAYLGVSVPTLRKYRRLGMIKHKMAGNRLFFTESALKDFLEGTTKGGHNE